MRLSYSRLEHVLRRNLAAPQAEQNQRKTAEILKPGAILF